MRKKVLIFGHNYAIQFIDVYNQYARLFDPAHYEVTIAYLTNAPDETVKKRTLAEHVVFLNMDKKSIRTLKAPAIKKMYRLCQANQFDIVICHRYKPTYIMMCVAKLMRIPQMIAVMHELNTMQSIKRRLSIALLGRRVLFAGVSNAVRDNMRRSLFFLPKEQIVTLYNVADIELTEPQLIPRDEARKLLQLNADDFVFSNLGRLVPNKDQATLIQAFAMIKPTCPKAKLIILGSGTLEKTLRAQVHELGLENDVIFTGFIDCGFRYMPAFDCFVLSSSQEAFGRVLIEAMIARLPLIGTRAHGIPEVIGEAGELVPVKDADALAAAMKHIYTLSPEERAALGDKAYKRVTAHFSLPAFKETFFRLISCPV